MKRLFIIGALIFIVTGITIVIKHKGSNNKAFEVKTDDTELLLSYFIETLTSNVKASIADYEQKGLAGGVDGFTLRETYPQLVPEDFNGVSTPQGDYRAENGKLFFNGNAASNSAVLEREGMRLLLKNCSKRLHITVNSKRNINQILIKLKD